MDDLRLRAELRTELAACHGDSFGWALCCCRRDRFRAEEVLQRAYLKVLEGAARYHGRGAFKTWLFAVIRTTAADDRRRELVRRLNLLRYADRARPSPPSPPSPGADEALDADARRAAFAAALNALPRRQREVLHLVFYHDLSLTEAAAVLGVSVGSARTHYDRGKKAIRRPLEEYEPDERRPRQGRTDGSAGGRPGRAGPTPGVVW